MNTLQHVNVKIFTANAEFRLAEMIPVFHRWIQEDTVPELAIDVADYKHVPDGPGIILIGHEADYSIDETGGRRGLLYNRKVAVAGDSQAALAQAYESAVRAAKLLEEDQALIGKLRFDYGDVEVILNDRLLYPNTDETWAAVKPEIERFFTSVFGADIAVEHRGEPRERLRVGVKRQ
jgi:hypothetical protein